jgi:23S rRNA pseudouridine1911/1915/1917 synthase
MESHSPFAHTADRSPIKQPAHSFIMPEQHTFTLSPELQGQRLDKALHSLMPHLSRTRLQELIRQGQVTLNGQIVRDPAGRTAGATHRASNDGLPEQALTLTVTVPPATPATLVAQDIPLHILYEDSHLVVLDKPAGLVVHPAPGNPDQTLVNALLAHCGDSLTGIGGEQRPGIVHRLDKETSGVMVAAKTAAAHAALVAQFQARTIRRSYQALVWGQPRPAAGLITGNIGRHPQQRQKMAVLRTGGREAATEYTTLAVFSAVTLVQCRLLTGRTHQIRVHLSHAGHPLVGDPVYSRQNRGESRTPNPLQQALRGFPRQALHAEVLGFVHPATGAWLAFETPLPADFSALLQRVRADA